MGCDSILLFAAYCGLDMSLISSSKLIILPSSKYLVNFVAFFECAVLLVGDHTMRKVLDGDDTV